MQVLHQGGGAGSVNSTLHLSLGLAAAGVDLRFVCPPESPVEQAARDAGLQVIPLRLEPHQRARNARAIRALLVDQPVDLVNSQSARDRQALTRLVLTGRLGVPLVVTRRQLPRTFFLENWLMSRAADRVIAVSRAVADALRRRGTPRRKLAVIPNGLLTDRIDQAVPPEAVAAWRERIGWDGERRTVGIVARRKEQRVVLRALERVVTPVRLVLAGVGDDPGLAELARALPARHAAVLLPYDERIRPLYELLEVALLPSRGEGLPQALLEAMALGKPVIAARVPGIAEVITDGTDGILVPLRDEAAWAAALERVLTGPDLARGLGQAARRTARERYSLRRTVDRTIALYHEVLERRAGR